MSLYVVMLVRVTRFHARIAARVCMSVQRSDGIAREQALEVKIVDLRAAEAAAADAVSAFQVRVDAAGAELVAATQTDKVRACAPCARAGMWCVRVLLAECLCCCGRDGFVRALLKSVDVRVYLRVLRCRVLVVTRVSGPRA